MQTRINLFLDFLRLGALAIALLLVGQSQSFAQSTYGTIVGTVYDPSGAVILNAKIEAKNEGTSATRTINTDAQGDYRFVNMDPGTYTITTSAQGFAAAQDKGVILPARETVRADVKLQVQAGGERIEVTSSQSVVSEVQTQSSSLSGSEINSLALNFRATNNPSPIVVADLTPGVKEDGNGNFSFSGQLPTATSFSIDGISTQMPRYGGPTKELFPSVEGISEFRVNTAANSAEYSQPTDLTVISRGGTNEFHGGGFWYLMRKDFNSPDQISGIIPIGDANTFGGSIGGPLSIPKLYNGKNRTFFYFDYEGIRLNQTAQVSTNTPPAAWRNGDFSGSGQTIVNPLTGVAFANNQIPSGMVNPVSAKIIPLFFPQPTNSSATLAGGPNLVEAFPGNYASDGFDGRLDHVFSENHRIWGRVTQKTITSTGTDGALGALGSGDSSYNPLMGTFSQPVDTTNIAGSYNWIIRPNLVNELRAGYSRADYSFTYPQAAQGDSIIASLGITGLPGSPKNGLGGVPVFYIGDLMGGATNPYGHPRVTDNGLFEIGDNLTWIKGKHSLKFGFEFWRMNYQDNITFLNGDEYGDYFFTGANDAQAFANFLLGAVGAAYQAQNGPDGKPYGYHYGGFALDEWRILPNFTLNYGLRYEVNTPFNDATDQLGNFDTQVPGGELVVQNGEMSQINPLWKAAVGNTPFVTASQVGLPDTLRYTYWDNIQPRLGIAWKPFHDDDTVIRASGGVYSVPVLGAVLYSLLGVDTSYFAYYPSTPTFVRTFPNVFAGSGTSTGYPSYRRANQWDLKDPRVIQWNFSIDHNLGHNTLARLTYTGSHTYNLIYSPDLNQVAPNTIGYAALTATPALRQQNLNFPNFAEVLSRANGPSDKYEAGTVEVNRRFASDLSFLNSYTYSKNITNALGVAPSSAIPLGGQGDNGDNVNNAYNIAADSGNAYFTPRHRFVSSLVYDLPLGRGKKYYGSIGRGANLLVGGWRVTAVTLVQTGPWLTPYFPTSVADPSGTNPSQRSVSEQRPDCAAGQTGYLSNPTTAQYFNAGAYSIPASNIGRFGNCGVGILEGPGTSTFSMSAGKSFPVTERVSLRYEAQFANLFNILNKAVPNMNVASGSFGLISQSQGAEQGGPRTIQMMLRLQF
jgi:hypothetical protein